jgi:hypothetical protein
MSLHWAPCGCATATGGGHHGVRCRIKDANGVECGSWTVPECVDETQRKTWNPGPQ